MSNADNVAGLNHFEIKAAGQSAGGHTVKIFRNGRQQYQVDIIIEAVDKNGHIINLSEDDMKTVTLMDYSSEKEFQNTFGRSYTWAGYELPGPASQETSPTPDAARSTLRFWEHVMPSATNAVITIAAKITLAGVVYKTNGTEADVGGKVVHGKSNSWYKVAPMTPERLRADSFQIRKDRNLGWGYSSGAPVNSGADERYFTSWEISFKDTSRKIYGSEIRDIVPIPWFSKYIQGNSPWRCLWVLPVRRNPDGQVLTVHLGWSQTGTTDMDIFLQPYYNDGVAYAVIEESIYMLGHSYNAGAFTYTDKNGNGHTITVRHNSNGREVVLADS